MNRILHLAAFVAASAACVPTWAQTVSERIEITAARTGSVERVLAEHRAETLYDMSNGRRLALASSGDTLELRYGRHLKRSLHARAGGGFVSADGLVQMAFDLDRHGVRQVHLTLPVHWQ